MAKNKVEIDVKVDDKGTTKKLGLESKKAAKGLEDTGKGARTADRNLKGAANASSNTTKNFSKMSQGVGGLVGAYATLAAQIFAVSAAFNFLKRAGDLKILQQGQTAYAAATGVAMKSLTEDIIAATDSQVTFQDAAQAAAIGVASGLNTDQLTRLGKAAKDASAVLGRDVTDSFNRLIRGVTKAEPELLDELGIILRLKDASEEYARALDKDATALTTFERSQAVANFVLEQSEEKYSRILAIVGVSTNRYAKLGKAFDDIINKVKEFAERVAGPLGDTLIKTPEIAFVALAAFLRPVLMTALPGLTNLSEKATAFAERSKAAFKSAKKDLEKYNRAVIAAGKDPEARAQLGREARSGLLSGLKNVSRQEGSVLDRLRAGEKLSNRQLGALRRQLNAQKGEFQNFTKAQRSAMFKHLDDLQFANSTATKKMTADYNKMQKSATKSFLRIKQTGARAINGLAKVTSVAVRTMGKLLNLAGIAGMIFSVGMLIKGFMTQGEKTEQAAKKTDFLGDKLKDVTEDMKHFVEVQKELNREGENTDKVITAIGRKLGNFSIGQLTDLSGILQDDLEVFREIRKDQEELAKVQETLKNLPTATYTTSYGVGVQASDGGMRSEGRKRVKELEENLRINEAYVEESEEFIGILNKTRDTLLMDSDARLRNSEQGKELLRVIEEINANRDVEAQTLVQAIIGYRELGSAIEQAGKLAEQNAKVGADFRKSLFPKTEHEKYLDTLRAQLTLEKSIQTSNALEAAQQREKIAGLQEEIRVISVLNDMKRRHASENRQAKLEFDQAAPLAPFPLLEKRRKQEFDLQQLKNQQVQQEQQRMNEGLLFASDVHAGKSVDLSAFQNKQAELNITIQETAEKIRRAEFALTEVGQIGQSVAVALGDSFTRAFQGIIDGTMSVKEGFASMAQGVLGAIARIISEMLAMAALKALFPGGLFGIKFGNRYGGIMSDGEKVRGYSQGGIARGRDAGYPAILHGTEAVVPLPNGRSIPVEMKGAAGQQNNVTVNISSDGQTSTQTDGGMDQERLGKAVAAAVQKELQHQKRSGGILSPYGAA
jgi:hypothetical protein